MLIVNSTSTFGTSHVIKSVGRCETSIVSHGSLRIDYDAVVEGFAVLKWGPLSLGTQPYSGFKIWEE